MIEIIRAITTAFDNTIKKFTSNGRYGETLTGRFFQHYGFKSSPPDGTEHINLRAGNAVDMSIAESDGIQNVTLADGDVCVGLDGDNKIHITKSDNCLVIKFDGNITIQSDHVYIGTSEDKYKLATENFVNNQYAYHSHAFTGTVSGSTCSGDTGIPTPPIFPYPNILTSTTEAN